MKVLKFGGSSVGTAESIRSVAEIVAGYHEQNVRIVVVVSALKGTTNALIEAGRQAAKGNEDYKKILAEIEKNHFAVTRKLIEVHRQSRFIAGLKVLLNEAEELLQGVFLLKELSLRTSDLLQSFGEQLSAFLVAGFFAQEGLPATSVDARKLICTDSFFGRAQVNFRLTNPRIAAFFAEQRGIPVVTGFIASNENQETTTLGRGGSDYTAAILAAALNASEIEIWTDVDGMMTADPQQVAHTFSLPAISYEEAMELSHFGAKVIYPPTLQPAFAGKIPLRIRNTFNPAFPGTLISTRTDTTPFEIKGISSIKNISLINFSGSSMVGISGISSRLFGVLGKAGINIIMITQASSEHSICFALTPEEANKAIKLLNQAFADEIESGKINPPILEEKLSIVAMIGENMRKTPGTSAAMFGALGKNGINVVAIAQGSSERNISVAIQQKHLKKALNCLHEDFFLSGAKTLNIFLVGTGLIGTTLIRQLRQQGKHLQDDYKLKINLVGLINTQKMRFTKNETLDVQQDAIELLSEGQPANLTEFVSRMKALDLPNSVFVDCTSSQALIPFYKSILSESISIVTPSKLANSGPYARYQELGQTAEKHGVKFMYETNVGAGLPVINPLKDLKISGDKILKIEGILSGTLSYIFNNFTNGRRFADVVREAKAKGFTEPDPREDLNGMDVARKILILAREAGFPLEPQDVSLENLLPEGCQKAPSVADFFEALDTENDYFEAIRQQAAQENKSLRFIATLENGKASVALRKIPADHPFVHISGSDNILSFTTARYNERPLLIRGPGAGAEVTAAGVFAEIISIRHYLN